jgi:hypothetical protein
MLSPPLSGLHLIEVGLIFFAIYIVVYDFLIINPRRFKGSYTIYYRECKFT